MCHLLELRADPRGAASSAFISDTTQFKTQVEMCYCFSQYQAVGEDENLTVTVVLAWETLFTTRTDGTQDVSCLALSLTHSLDYIQEFKRGDGEG